MNQERKSKFARLPDILILLAVIGLVTAAVGWWLSYVPETPEDQARYSVARQEVRRLGEAVRKHLADTGQLPNTLEDLVPKYLADVPVDPWGRSYEYEKWKDRAFVRCYGRDGKARGQGLDLDILAIIWLK